jgi:uncharacterized protein (DUF849 family)
VYHVHVRPKGDDPFGDPKIYTETWETLRQAEIVRDRAVARGDDAEIVEAAKGGEAA